MRVDLRSTLWARPPGAARMLVVKRTELRKMESFMAGSWNFRTALSLFQIGLKLRCRLLKRGFWSWT
jgi:hypothetical protein